MHNSFPWSINEEGPLMTCGELMTPSPTCCHPEHTITEVAEIMQREDVGLVPIIESDRTKLIGVLTDRDIVLKVVAAGRDPRGTAVSEVMTSEPIACQEQDAIETVMQQMAAHQVRRIPIVDNDGAIVGIVSQADLATRLSNPRETGEVVQAISEPAAT
jgi:CBS domain-containing protein